MKEQGKVIQIDGDNAVIEITPKEACSKCCSCGNAKPKKVHIKGEQVKTLQVGDIVDYEMDTSKMLKIYVLLYGIPLIGFLTGLFLTYMLTRHPAVSFGAGIILTLITYVLVGIYIRKKTLFLPTVCKR